MAHVLIVGNDPKMLINFRGGLIRAVVSAGHRVTAMSPPASAEQMRQIEALGARFYSYPLQRNGLNPLADIQTLVTLLREFARLNPDVVFAYMIKPIVWSGIAAFLTKAPHFYALIEGLGYPFQGRSWGRKLLGRLSALLYRTALAQADKVVLHNPDNKAFFIAKHLVAPHKIELLDGMGLDLDWYAPSRLPEGSPVFLCMARLLAEKGLREYAQAARIVKQRYPEAVFRLLGPADPSPNGIPPEEVRQWQEQGAVEYLGETGDVRPCLAACHIFVLPSFYGEGLPRSIMEAMSVGRPILTTDNVGCRETVVPGENGFLVPVRDAEALAERMIWFIEHRGEWPRMGQASRRIAERRFDAHTINAEMLRIMNLSREQQTQPQAAG